MAQPVLAEVVPGAGPALSDQERFEASVSLRNRRRIQIFLVVLLVSAAACLGWNYARAPVYESTATLGITPRTNLERRAGVDPPSPVEVQRQMMLSPSVQQELFARVSPLHDGDLTPAALRRLVGAHRVPDTDTVRLRAEGPDPRFPPLVLNAWAEIYLARQRAAEEAAAAFDDEAADKELEALEAKLEAKRAEIETFRRERSIVSPERQENQVASRLGGLNAAHNRAIEREVEAKANLAAVTEALRTGKLVGSTQETRSLSSMLIRAEQMREQLRDYEQNFTSAYMRIDPKIVALKANLEDLEQRIEAQREELSRSVLAEAEREVEASGAARLSVRRQLEELRTEADRFSADFAQLKSLLAELGSLEELVRERKRRWIELRAKAPTLPPQVRVVEAAYTPDAPVRPLYTRDAAIGLGGSLLLGLLSALAYEFFIRPVVPPPRPTSATLIYAGDALPAGTARDAPLLARPAGAAHALPRAGPRELSQAEVSSLLDETEPAPAVQALLCVLMTGLTLEEAACLSWSDIDEERSTIRISGKNARTLGFSGRLRTALTALAPDRGESAVWHTPEGAPLRVAELRHLVAVATTRSVGPSSASVEDLRHTYVAFLARQGAENEDILRIVGDVDPADLDRYEMLAPPGRRLPFSELALTYPPLATG